MENDKCIFPPNFKEIPAESKLRGIYVEFKSGLLSFDYASWDFHNSAYSLYLAQEILKHFKVLKVGFDSIGWCAIDEFKKYKDFVPVEKILRGIPSLRKKMKRSAKRLIEKHIERENG